jgi:hypothetical protein
MYLLIIIIFAGTIKVLQRNKDLFLSKIKNKKKILLFLLLIVVVSSVIKIAAFDSYFIINNSDSSEYVIESEAISLTNKFVFVCDPPGFPVMINFLRRLGFLINAGFIVNLISSMLSVFLIFIFVQLLFMNHKISLLAAVLFSFSPLHTGSVIVGFPMPTSILFILIGLIMVIIALSKNDLFAYSLIGLSIGFAFHLFYIESVFIVIAILWMIIKKGLKFVFNVKLWLVLFVFFITILPFIILQNTSTNNECITYTKYPRFQNTNDPMCKILRNYCGLYDFKYIFKNSEIKESFINDIDGNLLSYFSFLFLGYGVDDYHYTTSIWKRLNDYTYNPTYWFSLFFIMIGLILSLTKKIKIKSLYLLLSLLIVYLLAISLYYGILYLFSVPIIVLFKIPLLSFGIYHFLKRIKITYLRYFFLVIILLILLSQIFVRLDFEKPRFGEEKTNKDVFCNRYESYKEPCYSLHEKIDWNKLMRDAES